MKKPLLFLCALCFSANFAMESVHAQSLSIIDFTELNDLDARAYEPILDQNGRKCAILKIVTTENGFTFDVGALGVRKVVYKTAEIWVYVPPQTSKIKIAHPKLGQLKTETKDGYYWFPTGGVHEATCYRMELVSGRLRTIVEEEEIPTGFLVITTEPTDADLYITPPNGAEEYVGRTPYQNLMAYGTYHFRVVKELYHEDRGIAQLNQNELRFPLRLIPNFGTLQVNSTPSGARVSIDGSGKTYTTPCTIEQIVSDDYTVRVFMERYSAETQDVTIQDGKTTTLDFTLKPRFTAITVNTIDGASIFINGKECGKTTCTEELNEGICNIEARLASHTTAKKQVQVVANQPQTIQLTPEPITGSLVIMTNPIDATVTLNGEQQGSTPFRQKLLVGEYAVTLSKDGYQPLTKQVVITEKQTVSLNETLARNDAPARPAAPPVVQRQPQTNPQKTQEEKPQQPEKKKAAYPNSFFFALNGGLRFMTIPSIGLTIGQELHRSGWYLTAATGFGYKAFSASDICNANGTLSDGSIPPYTGNVNYSRLSVVAGSMFRLHPTTAIYVGLGYGYNSHAWEVADGNWMRNADRTIQGVDVQLGLHFNLKGFVLRAGVATTNFKTLEGTIGIGYAIK